MACGVATLLLSGCVAVPMDQGYGYQAAPAAAAYPAYPAAGGGAVVYPGATYYAPNAYYGVTPGYYGPSVSLGIYGGSGGGYHPPPRPGRPGMSNFDRPGFNRPNGQQPSRFGERPSSVNRTYAPRENAGAARNDHTRPERASSSRSNAP
jgi:hypothetical protein